MAKHFIYQIPHGGSSHLWPLMDKATIVAGLEGGVFWSKCFFLGIAGKNSRFCQNSLTYRDSVMVIFRFLGQNGLKLELRAFAVHKILMEH